MVANVGFIDNVIARLHFALKAFANIVGHGSCVTGGLRLFIPHTIGAVFKRRRGAVFNEGRGFIVFVVNGLR